MTDPYTEIYALNESSVTIVFGNAISEDLAEKVLLFDRAIEASPFQGFITTIPAYATLTVCYDPKAVLNSKINGESSYEKVSNYLSSMSVGSLKEDNNRRQMTIPVCYGGEFGPDLELVSTNCNLSTAEIISLHSAATYTVYMIGFVPGFAYMGGMDKQLTTPRKEQPRNKVTAGSVGIAGGQTGIYSLDIPGGWQIIGKTPLILFDAARPEPSLLKAGDEVSFSPISIEEFHSLKA